jgi:hypothetical protein
MRATFLAIMVVALGAMGSCTYAPDFANDKLVCGQDGTCPKGYTCATSDNKCWKNGETPGGGTGGSDGGTHPGTGGAHMDAGSDVPISNDPRTGFVGTWTFTGGTLNGSCSDGSVVQRPLTSTDYMLITLGTTASTVLAQYYCQAGWTMQLSSGNTMAVAPSNQTCVQRTTDNTVNPPITTAYTWSAVTFSFTKTGANTGMSTGHLMGPFAASDNTSGTCDLSFTGPLTRN